MFGRNNVQLTADQIAGAGKLVQPGDYRGTEFAGACFEPGRQGAVRQRAVARHHLRDLGAVGTRAAVSRDRAARYSFSVSPARGCHFIRCRSIRPTAASSSSANSVSTRMPAITVLMSNAPSACRIR